MGCYLCLPFFTSPGCLHCKISLICWATSLLEMFDFLSVLLNFECCLNIKFLSLTPFIVTCFVSLSPASATRVLLHPFTSLHPSPCLQNYSVSLLVLLLFTKGLSSIDVHLCLESILSSQTSVV